MERGALVPDDLAIRFVLARLGQPDAAEGAILDGFPRTRQQAEALDAALAKRGAAASGAPLHRGPRERAPAPPLGPLGLPAPRATRTTASSARPPTPANATSTARSSISATTTGRPPCGSASSGSCRRCTRSSTTTPIAGSLPPSMASSPSRRSPMRSCGPSPSRHAKVPVDDGLPRSSRDPQERRPDRAHGRRRPSRGRRPRCGRGRHPPGHLDPRARCHRGCESSALPGRRPRSSACPAREAPFRHALCISIDDEVVHGIPSGRSHRARGLARLGRCRRHRRRLARRRRADLHRRRPCPTPPRDSSRRRARR